jgi:hypothetical protein
MTSKFRIVMKKERPFARRQVAECTGNTYFISSRDSEGYARFVVVEYKDDKTKVHKLVLNAHDISHIYIKLLEE